jgi:hypothetical protein
VDGCGGKPERRGTALPRTNQMGNWRMGSTVWARSGAVELARLRAVRQLLESEGGEGAEEQVGDIGESGGAARGDASAGE